MLSFSEIGYCSVGNPQVALPLGVAGVTRRQFLRNCQTVSVGLRGFVELPLGC
jgi:hypothetical protein